jgi:hypothetical protein
MSTLKSYFPLAIFYISSPSIGEKESYKDLQMVGRWMPPSFSYDLKQPKSKERASLESSC